MAFWKRLRQRTSSENKKLHDVHQISECCNKPAGGSPIIAHSFSTGDLGESLSNSLHLVPDQKPFICKEPASCVDNLNGEFGDLGNFHGSESVRPRIRKSRLSKNLQEILADLSALTYFQQYLESKQVASYLTLLNDIKNYYLLANSLPTLVNNHIGDGAPSVSCSSTTNDQQRLLDSTSSSSGFSDDTSLDSPSSHKPYRSKQIETETMAHTLHCEKIRIIQKYFDCDSSDYLPSISKMLDSQHYSGESIDIIAPDVFLQVQLAVWNLLETNYVPEYLHSEYNYRYQLDIINGRKLLITDILYNDTCLFYFMEFMDQIGKRHWLEFWLAAENYRSQWNVHNASSDALIIYNKYFSLQANQPLGLSDLIRSTIEENICVAEGPGPDCFEYPLHVLFCDVEKKCLQPFLASPVYCQYVSEIVTALKNAELSSSRHKRSGSSTIINGELSGGAGSFPGSASNAASGSLLAVEDPIPFLAVSNSPGHSSAENAMIRVVNNISNDSLVIDLKQLNDPDSLWQRKKNNLSFGRLTSLGRFHSETDLPPTEKKSGLTFSKAVKKFVSIEDEEEKQEVAWQVAEMIVKEVIQITLEANQD